MDYAQTRASDSKYLPAVILNIFFVNILGLCLISLYRLKKLSFTMVFYKQNFEMLSMFDKISSNVLLSPKVQIK